MVGELLRRIGMHVKLAKTPAEGLVMLDRHGLVTEEDHQVLHQRVMHFPELLVTDVL